MWLVLNITDMTTKISSHLIEVIMSTSRKASISQLTFPLNIKRFHVFVMLSTGKTGRDFYNCIKFIGICADCHNGLNSIFIRTLIPQIILEI